MSVLSSIFSIFGKEHPDASRIQHAQNDGQPDNGRGLHPFASRRERALSDLSRVRMLAKTLSPELLRIAQHGEGNSLREITTAFSQAAKASGCFIENNACSQFGSLKRRRSGESLVYVPPAGDEIIKIKNPTAKQHIKASQPSDWPFEHIIHNILFPETAYEFIGISEELDEPRIILNQSNVESVAFPPDEQIAGYLQNVLGLIPEDRYFFGNKVLSVTDVGAHSDNVLLGDDNRLYFIDPLIRLKKPALVAIEYLTGATLTCA